MPDFHEPPGREVAFHIEVATGPISQSRFLKFKAECDAVNDVELYERFVVEGGELSGLVALIPLEGIVIGRSPDCGLVLSNATVSRRHAHVFHDRRRAVVADLESHNGVLINGGQITRAVLNDGDLLQVGDVLLRFHSGVGPSPAPQIHTPHNPPNGTPEILPSEAPVTRQRQPREAKPQSRGQQQTRPTQPLPAKVAAEANSKRQNVPWYRRGQTIVLALGALAGAVLGVLNLWYQLFPKDDEDVATIEEIYIAKATTLSDFEKTVISGNMFQSPTARGVNPGDPGVTWRSRFAPAMTASRLSGTTPLTASQSSSSLPNETEGVPPSETEGVPPSATDQPSPTPTDNPGLGKREQRILQTSLIVQSQLPDNFLDVVTDQPVLDQYQPEVREKFIDFTRSIAVDAKGEIRRPEVAAPLATTMMGDVLRSRGAEKDLRGWTVAVKIQVEGLANVPLFLTWSLDGVEIADSWTAENLVYQVMATKERDRGSVYIWIPELKKNPSTYNLNVTLTYRDGTPADSEHCRLSNC